VDEKSHFDGKTKTGNKYAPELGAFVTTPKVQASFAKISDAYPGVELSRRTAIIIDAAFARPIIVDLFKATSDAVHQYDLPFHYNGQLIETNFTIEADSVSRSPLGIENGYQYLWKTADAEPVNNLSQLTFLLDRRFYSLSTATPSGSKIVLAETGANDPNFNLRREPALIIRAENQRNASFATVIESHGEYNPTLEFTVNSHSGVANVNHEILDGLDVVTITTKTGEVVSVSISETGDVAIKGTNPKGEEK